MKRRRLKYLLIFVVLAIAVSAQLLYWRLTTRELVFALGPQHGQHGKIMNALAKDVDALPRFKVSTRESEGSLKNLEMLRDGKVQFALYQSGAQRMKGGLGDRIDTEGIAFVCNVYLEVVHWIVHKDSGITDAADLRGKRIAVGREYSGDSAISEVLAGHFGLEEGDFKPSGLEYTQILDRFEAGKLDAAFITVGTHADIFRELSKNENLEFRSLENIPALVANHIALSPYTIQKGLYRPTGNVTPAEDIHTVALKSQLLCRKDLPDSVVERVTETALSEEFMRTQQLRELFSRGREFARSKPEFAMHPGAEHYYDPELKPILNSNFVEAMEGMRSFLVSLLIAGFVAWRSWKKWTEQQAEHRLDRYIRRLLEFERKQVSLGISPDALQKDEKSLRKLLDDVTDLRQDCLRDFTAHELNEDRSVDCFLEMCHALSDKINAKLLRVHLDQRFEELAASLHEKTGREAKLPAGE
jgi:TRAP transporter TAXI family solute receptor